GANVPAEGLQLSGTASDNHRVEEVEVQVDGGAWEPANGTTSWTRIVILPAAGANKICARATDAAGNQGPGNDCVTVDSRPPRVLAEVKIAPAVSDLDPKKSLQLKAEALDTSGAAFDPALVQWKWTVVQGKGTIDQSGLFTAANETGKVVVKVTGTSNGVTKEATAEIYVGGGSPPPGGGGGLGSIMAFLTSPLFLLIIVLLVVLIVAGAVASARRKRKKDSGQNYESGFPQM
ncbi:MAG TPA: hypothetical protein VI893_08900, partial [Thermoplasmata archaeon]|nr:hypothetical protein [Thermoplasmata archaeon]